MAQLQLPACEALQCRQLCSCTSAVTRARVLVGALLLIVLVLLVLVLLLVMLLQQQMLLVVLLLPVSRLLLLPLLLLCRRPASATSQRVLEKIMQNALIYSSDQSV